MVDDKSPGQEPASPTTVDVKNHDASAISPDDEKSPTAVPTTHWQKIIDTITYTPPWCRWDPEKPPKFSIWHNILFAFAGAFTVGNLYYNHPILNVLARDFDVPYVTVSRIPTLMQAGYATGLLFICPLGDLLRRRPLTLVLIAFTATMW